MIKVHCNVRPAYAREFAEKIHALKNIYVELNVAAEQFFRFIAEEIAFD